MWSEGGGIGCTASGYIYGTGKQQLRWTSTRGHWGEFYPKSYFSSLDIVYEDVGQSSEIRVCGLILVFDKIQTLMPLKSSSETRQKPPNVSV